MAVLSRSQINGIKDFSLRTVLLALYDQQDATNQAIGQNWLEPVNSQQKPASAAPAAPTISVTGSNGIFTVSLTPPSQSANKQVYFEVSYSPKSNFSESVTTMQPTQATSVLVHEPGATYYFRCRCSYDRTNWSAYSYA